METESRATTINNLDADTLQLILLEAFSYSLKSVCKRWNDLFGSFQEVFFDNLLISNDGMEYINLLR